MAMAAVLIIVSAFGPKLVERPAGSSPMALRVAIHVTLFLTWTALFAAQTLLIATRRARTHRRLGYASLAVAAAMILTAPELAIGFARRGGPDGGDPLAFLLVLLTDILLFTAFVGGAIYFRRRRDVHKRLMILAMLDLLPAAIVRWPIAPPNVGPAVTGVVLVLIAALVVNDFAVQRRAHPASVWGGLLLLGSIPLRFAVAQTALWHHFAGWLVR